MQMKLPGVRLAFPQLFTAATVNGEGEPAFSCSLLVDGDSKLVAVINAAIDDVAKDKWADKAAGFLKTMRATDKVCLHDGDTKANYGGYAGNFFVACRSKTRPSVVDRDRTQLTEQDGRVYSGCYVNAMIEIWAMDNKYGKRICAQIRGVQFVKDGEAFSGGTPASADDFDDLGMEEDESLV